MRRLGIIALALSLGAVASAQETTTAPHVAVVADANSGDLASIVFADLSNDPALALVERNDLAKVGDEVKLQQLAGDNPISLGQLLGADGLLFLKKQPTGFHVRLTAVGLGYAVFDDFLTVDANTDLPHVAQSIAQRVAGYATKLKLKPGAAVPISVLNVRANSSSDNAISLEQKLSLLLESKLAAQPDYVVLERRHAGAILFEKELSIANPQSALEGAYVVDGSFDQAATPGANDLTVHLRLRSPTSQENPLELNGSSNDPGALADQMATAIQKAIGKPGPAATWQPEKEARAYLLEGIWAWQHGNFNAALQALDSADVLGEKAPDLEAARIHVLCCKAVGSTDSNNVVPATPDDPHPEARVEAIRRAFDEEQRFAAGGAQQPLQILTNRDMGGMLTRYHSAISQAAASLLVMLDRTHSSEADDIRSQLRGYIHFDPVHGQLPQQSEDFHMAIENADNLAVSPEEEKACYHLAMVSPDLGPWLAVENQLQPDTFCARFIPDLNARQAAFTQFLQGLMADETARPLALYKLAAWSKPATSDQGAEPKHDQSVAFQNYVDDLWNERDRLLAGGRFPFFLDYAFSLESSSNASAANPRILDTLHFLLQRSNGIDGRLARAWHPELFPAADAPTFWNELQALAAKSSAPESSFFFDQMRSRYVNRWGLPQEAPHDATSAQALVVNRFWYPKDAAADGKYALNERHPLIMDATGAWVPVVTGGGGEPLQAKLYHVGIDATQADPFTTAPAMEPPLAAEGGVLTADALYLVGSPVYQWGVKWQVARYDLRSQQWDQYDVPHSGDIFRAAGHLYLSLLGPDIRHLESGIGRYDEQTGATIPLASSRRSPPQNQFDNRTFYTVRGIFTGPGNKPCASIGFGETYVINEKPGDWARMVDSGGTDFIAGDGTRSIIYGSRDYRNKSLGDVVFMIDPSKDQPELLLGGPAQSQGTEMVGAYGPMPAPWPRPPVWPTPATGAITSSEYGFRNNDLFACVTDKATFQTEIVWFQRGRPEPIHIPLSFELNDEVAGVYKKIEDAEPARTRQFLKNPQAGGKMYWGPTGIFFAVTRLGFYFLPYTDIDAYLKAHGGVATGNAPLPPATSPAQSARVADNPPASGQTSGGANAAPAPPPSMSDPAQNTPAAGSAASHTWLGKFKGHLVVLKNGQLQAADPGALDGVKYVTFLFAASWYKPSGEIMQHVLPFYYSLKSKHPEYEMIFVDNPESADDMERYMTSFKMPWPAVRSGDPALAELGLDKLNEDESIPCLVLVDESGKILSNSRVNGKWVGVFPVMQDTEKMLPVSSESP